MAIQHVKLFLSGGSGNTDPNASLGGVISTQAILSQQATGLSTVTGVTIDDANSNPTGAGTLTFTFTGTTLKWASYGNSAGATVNVSLNGTYILRSNNSTGNLVVTVVSANLPVGNAADVITIANLQNKIYDDQSSLEVFNGHTDYRCIYIKNTGASTENNVKVWTTQPIAASELWIGFDLAGKGDGVVTGVATTVANETTPPAGVTFSKPITQASGLTITSLANNECQAIWTKRIIAAGDRTEQAEIASINFSAFV